MRVGRGILYLIFFFFFKLLETRIHRKDTSSIRSAHTEERWVTRAVGLYTLLAVLVSLELEFAIKGNHYPAFGCRNPVKFA